MNAAATRPRTGFKFMLFVKEGPDRGVSFQLLPPQVTIGRDPENNIALNDPRVSRKAAVIQISLEKIVITNLSAKQPLMVDEELVTEMSIADGAVIRLGGSELVFSIEALPLPPINSSGLNEESNLASRHFELATAHQGLGVVPNPASPDGPGPVAKGAPKNQDQSRRRASAPADTGKRNFYLIVGLLLLFLLWLLTSSPVKLHMKDPTVRGYEEVQKDIEGSEKRSEDMVKRRSFKSDEEKTRFEEANRHFQEGFRDYQKGQWSRALRSFETARAIDPSHELALRYFKLAEKQRDDEVAHWTLEGRQYKEKEMYSRCSAALEKVLDIITNREDLKYKQAEALKKECDLLAEDRYR